MIIVSVLVGYLIGSIPSAGLLGRVWGVKLRDQGSGNPGTVNALQTAGPMLAASVLIVEAAKGYGAVWAGSLLADETGAIATGLGAIAGNVYNVWYRLQGGKGLGISLGVLAGVWPLVLLPVLAVLVVAVIISRSSGTASLTAIAGLAVMAVLWVAYEWPTGGVAPSG
ncbi:MAG: glycerol-3-phosphate acyltransferase, partial [Acidimicrobiia bacterium]